MSGEKNVPHSGAATEDPSIVKRKAPRQNVAKFARLCELREGPIAQLHPAKSSISKNGGILFKDPVGMGSHHFSRRKTLRRATVILEGAKKTHRPADFQMMTGQAGE